ncbi:MAG TPA: hypothetical protein VGK99_09730 [Acidobacteriota bacterium]
MKTLNSLCYLLLTGGLYSQGFAVQKEDPAQALVSIVELAKKTDPQKQSARKYSNASLPELRRARVSYTTHWQPPQPETAVEGRLEVPVTKQALVGIPRRPDPKKNSVRDEDKVERKKDRARTSRRRAPSRSARRLRPAGSIEQSKPSPLLWQPPGPPSRPRGGK